MIQITKTNTKSNFHIELIENSLLQGVQHLSDNELKYITDQLKNSQNIVHINYLDSHLFIVNIDTDCENWLQYEKARKLGHKIHEALVSYNCNSVSIESPSDSRLVLSLAEGIAMSTYSFTKYLKNKEGVTSSLQQISIVSQNVSQQEIRDLNASNSGNFLARTLVNEPQSYLTATAFSEEMRAAGKDVGFSVEVFEKSKIESLKMGGLLAVNKGSIEPPTFNILEYKSSDAKNSNPYVLVGKGVVYDTGGLSLKPTGKSMDFMKSDMGGAAAVVGTITALAKAKTPIHIIGLVPATDNRPSGMAYAPGDVITMYNGTTVEVLNTDAEGRLVLADALTYAQKFNPELVIDLATLTGAASRTVSTLATCSVATADKNTHNELKESGMHVHERLAELPFWDDYADFLKSDIADMTNLGGVEAGTITAGKFLEHFTKNEDGKHAYPWIHLDIAGPAFLHKTESYRGKNGTGVGVRMLFNFFNKKVNG